MDIKPRMLATAIDLYDERASLQVALSVAGYSELTDAQAREIARRVAQSIGRWRDEASHLGFDAGQIKCMATAFEHDDFDLAVKRNITRQ